MDPVTSKFYCVWADRGLALHNSGAALLCCHSRNFLKDNNQQQIFWHSHTMDDAWHSPTRQEIQQALHRGEQHPNCSACWDEENVGKVSRRMAHLDIAEVSAQERALDSVLYLDLKLGNVCNLACRTCNPWVSSNWYHDWYNTMPEERKTFPVYRDYVLNKHKNSRLSYNDDNNEFWADLDRHFKHVKYVDIYGAEPMMIDKLFEILENNITSGHSQNQTLHFNTNATIWDEHKIQILDQYKKVYFDLSLDGISQHYDYIRYGRTWQEILPVVDNYLKFACAGLLEESPRHAYSIVITVSIFNIWYLDQIWEFWQQYTKGQFNMHFNMAHLPNHINIKSIPRDVKELIAKKLSRYQDQYQEFQEHVLPVINYLLVDLDPDQQQRDWQEFVRVTQELDSLRDQNFANTFPEFFDLLKPYFKLA